MTDQKHSQLPVFDFHGYRAGVIYDSILSKIVTQCVGGTAPRFTFIGPQTDMRGAALSNKMCESYLGEWEERGHTLPEVHTVKPLSRE